MTQDKRAEIVEAMAAAWNGETADCSDPKCKTCTRAAEVALDIALKAAAEIADGFRCGACGMDGASAAAIRALMEKANA